MRQLEGGLCPALLRLEFGTLQCVRVHGHRRLVPCNQGSGPTTPYARKSSCSRYNLLGSGS